mgnify:CR=1 FL=1|tara:strand:- start:36 stop:227 length:192 start_codon:yes stop_codon:yes gene_type:complete
MKIKKNTKLHMKKLKWLKKELKEENVKTNFPAVRARIILEVCSVKSTVRFEQWLVGMEQASES